MKRKRDPFSLARSLVEPAWRRDEDHLYHHLPYGVRIGDEYLTTRDGDVMGAVELFGVNPDTETERTLDDFAEIMERILLFAAQDIAIYVHRFSFPAGNIKPVLTGSGFADAVDQRWTQALNASRLYERRCILTAVYRPAARFENRVKFGRSASDVENERDEDIEALDIFFRDVLSAFGPDRSRRMTHEKGDWLGLYNALLTGRYHPVHVNSDFEPIAWLMPETPVTARGDRLHFEDEPDWRGAMLTLKTYPPETTATVLDGLNLPCVAITTQSYSPMTPAGILEKIRRRRGQMRSSGDAAVSLEQELGTFADDIASGRITAGQHHLNVALFGESREIDDAISNVVSAVQRFGGSLRRERWGMRAAYFAQHPGNFSYRSTLTTISNANFADLAGAHMRPAGLPSSERTWSHPLTEMPTTTSERYRFDLHAPKRIEDELPPGHTLVLGPTGSGKTAYTAFLMAQAKRCGARLIVFDKDRGLEMPLRALGADYIKVTPGEATGFNPLAEAVDEASIGWLANWFCSILSQNSPLSAVQIAAISEACRENGNSPENLRTFQEFAGHFGALPDDSDLENRFSEWTPGGRLGWMFDGRGQDPFANRTGDIAFDITAILDDELMRLAWLGYLFRRIEARVEDGRPTIIVMDEAWKLLDNGYFAAVIKDWFVTMRKKNASVVMMTQLPEHINDSKSGPSILQSVQTQVLFPNRDASVKDLLKIGCNEREIEVLRARAIGRLALCRTVASSLWLDLDLGALGPLLKVITGGDGEKLNLPENWRTDPNFWRTFTHA